jgi:capsule polysaccharide export protein KpsE/RkpR
VSIRPLFAALALLALAGCAADPAPNEQMRLTEQALEQAKAVGANADDVPEMKLAEDKYNRAKGSMADDSFKNARMRAEQAELDARLAEAKVLTLKSEEQLHVLDTRITRLRKQLGDAQ